MADIPDAKPVLVALKFQFAQELGALINVKAEDLAFAVEDRNGTFSVPTPKLRKFKIVADGAAAQKWVDQLKPSDAFEKFDVTYQGEGAKATPYINAYVNRTTLIPKILAAVFDTKESYGHTKDYAGKKVLVEYSSPNIAKPFHAGHLRSTIIGNFLRNLYRALGADVTGINYLGDWGTQYGLLAVGFEKYGSEEKLKENPIRHLFDIYVAVNKDSDADPTVKERARAYFKRMEDGDEAALGLWRKFRDLSIEEYKKIYERLNVQFDVYSGESLQSNGMKLALKALEDKKLLTTDDQGGEFLDLKKYKLGVSVVRKADGATLYITRDIAAAKSRFDEYAFNKSIYVVASQQDFHFKQLFKTLELMGYSWFDKCEHVNFGMVNGMKTRKGTVVFLEDILNEAKSVMLDIMKEDKMGKLAEVENPEQSADIIGLSAVVIQDLSAKRIKDYDFDWARMTSSEGNTGPYLQYAHARLCSMEDKTTEIPLERDADGSKLGEKEALELALAIGRYPLILKLCSENHEPCTLVNYLFDLCSAISVAHGTLRVKGQPLDVAKPRKLLFWAARVVLSNALKLLSLIPLTRM